MCQLNGIKNQPHSGRSSKSQSMSGIVKYWKESWQEPYKSRGLRTESVRVAPCKRMKFCSLR